MGCKDFLLFFQNVSNLFLKSKVFFPNIVIFQCRLHYIYILFNLLFINLIHFSMNLFLNLLFDVFFGLLFTVYTDTFRVLLVLRWLSSDRRKIGLLLSGIWSAVCLSLIPSLFLFFILFHFLLFLLFFLFGTESWIIRERWRRWFFLRKATFILKWLFIALYVFEALYFLNVIFGELALNILTLVFLLIHLIKHFVHLRIIL